MAKEAELPFAMQLACKQRKYLTKKLDRCFVNGSRPTGEILVSWCANTKTNEAVRYFGNEQLTTLSTANRACEEGQYLKKIFQTLPKNTEIATHSTRTRGGILALFRFLGNI